MRRPWKLKAAIAGLEAQRSALGNSVVESAVSLDSVGIHALSGSERRGGRVSLACVEQLPVTRGLSSQISIRCFDDSGFQKFSVRPRSVREHAKTIVHAAPWN